MNWWLALLSLWSSNITNPTSKYVFSYIRQATIEAYNFSGDDILAINLPNHKSETVNIQLSNINIGKGNLPLMNYISGVLLCLQLVAEPVHLYIQLPKPQRGKLGIKCIESRTKKECNKFSSAYHVPSLVCKLCKNTKSMNSRFS